jgi:signal peptidase II
MEQGHPAVRYRPLIIGFTVIMFLDQFTKILIRWKFTLYESVPVIDGFFNLTYIANPGAAFGLFSGIKGVWLGRIFILITLVAIPLVVYLYREVESKDRWLGFALILVGGGALGNLIDRLTVGPVTDFLDFHIGLYHWPAFNVADSCITIGVAVMIASWLLPHRRGG